MKIQGKIQAKRFQNIIWKFYREHKRDFPWRNTRNPYKILVSEIMLQQTQTHRVVPKYASFLKRFPNLKKLRQSNLLDVLNEWKGLGYNRRAKALYEIAKKIHTIPNNVEELEKLPGIGPNTARSIMAFAFNSPVVFIETNIRTVFIHEFFSDKNKIHDKDILDLVEKTLDIESSREWYYALMDYGSYLKKTIGNLNTKSLHHVQQSPFKGSNRELRSKLLDSIRMKPQTVKTLIKLHLHKEAIEKNLKDLEKEGFIERKKNKFLICSY